MQALKEKAASRTQIKRCRYCNREKVTSPDPDVSEFYELAKGSGRFSAECKTCTKERVNRQAKERRRVLKTVAEGNAPSGQAAAPGPANPFF